MELDGVEITDLKCQFRKLKNFINIQLKFFTLIGAK